MTLNASFRNGLHSVFSSWPCFRSWWSFCSFRIRFLSLAVSSQQTFAKLLALPHFRHVLPCTGHCCSWEYVPPHLRHVCDVEFTFCMPVNLLHLQSMSQTWQQLCSTRRPPISIAFKSYIGSRKAFLRILVDVPVVIICGSISNSTSGNAIVSARVRKRVGYW